MFETFTQVCSNSASSAQLGAGNAIATVRSKDSVKLATVRSTSFPAAPNEGGDGKVETIAGI